jgi:hypothetical protein
MRSRVPVSVCAFVGHAIVLRQVPIRLMEFLMEYKRSAPREHWLFHQDGFFSQVPAPWIGTSNEDTPTVTSQIPHFWRGIWAKCRGILGVQEGIEDRFFYFIRKHFLMEYRHYYMPKRLPRAQPTTQFSTPWVWPWYQHPPLTAGFLSQQLFFNRQKWRTMLLTTLSAGAIPLFTARCWLNSWSQGTLKCTLAFSRTKSAHNNQLEMALENSGCTAVVFKNGGGTAALGGGVGRWFKIAADALGGGGRRRTWDDGIGISIVETKGLLLGC